MSAPPTSASGARVLSSECTESGTWMLVLPWELSAPGGVSQVVENLFDAAERVFGQRSLLFVNTWGQRDTSFATVDGRRTVRLAVHSPAGAERPARRLLGFLMRLPQTLLRLRRLLRGENVSRVSIHYPALDALNWVLARRLVPRPPKLALSFHGSDFQEARLATGIERWLWRLLLSSADDVTVCSAALRDEMVATFGPVAARVREVQNGVDPHRIRTEAQPAPRETLPANFLLSLATIERKKGLDTLIDAFARTADRFPEVSLVLAGRVAEPEYFERLRAQAAALPCRERIVFLPNLPHDDAMRVLARARTLVLASRKEPFGIVVLEAGALGVPVVATSVCGVVACLGERPPLTVVPPEDPAAMAQAIAGLLADPEAPRRAADALRTRVDAEFSWDRVAGQYHLCSAPADTERSR